MILEVITSGPAATNAILLACPETRKAALIDMPVGSTMHQLDRCEELGLTIEMLLLTHSHWDHMAETAQIKKALNIPLYVHREDAENVRHPGADGLPLFFPIPGVEPDYFLEDGQILPLGQLKLQVIHTPGHSPGGVCFYIESEHLLISGDTLFRSTIGNLSFPTSNPERMWESLKKLAKLPKETRVIPGHGDETTIGDENWIKFAKERFGG